MEKILFFIKRLIPQTLFKRVQPVYHFVLNFFAALFYRFPSEKLIVVGVTGTTGKTTTVYMIAQMLKHAGINVGYTSTAMFGDGKHEWLNDKKMTMVGRFFTQKILRQMVRNHCQVAIVETTSEGAVQFRHRFINYDIFVFTGLYPEHIESHGSFENYMLAKLSLFQHVEKSRIKKSDGKTVVPKTIIINGDDEHASAFLDHAVDEKIVFVKDATPCTTQKKHIPSTPHLQRVCAQATMCVPYKYCGVGDHGIKMMFDTQEVHLQLLGVFTATNAAAAGCVGRAIGLRDDAICAGLSAIKGIPGRLEMIPNTRGATIIVDYAFEPVALTKLYETIEPLHPRKIVHVFGAAGGGRDRKRRAITGRFVGAHADSVIVTNEDPYDDDPREIMEMVAQGVRTKGKRDNENLWIIADRQQAIDTAVQMLHDGDLLLITGKGSEQAIAGPSGVLIPWDDRRAVKKALKKVM